MENKVTVELHLLEEEFKQYGDVSAVIHLGNTAHAGGIYSWDELVKELKWYHKRLTPSEPSTKQ